MFTKLRSQAQIFEVFADARLEVTRSAEDQVGPGALLGAFDDWVRQMIAAEDNYFAVKPDGFVASKPFTVRNALLSRYVRRWSKDGSFFAKRNAADGNAYAAYCRLKLLPPDQAKVDNLKCIEKLLRGLILALEDTGLQ